MDFVTIAITFGIFAAVAGFVGAIAYFSIRGERKRTEAMRLFAGELGFEFLPDGDPAFVAVVATFWLGSQGVTRRLWNLLRGRTDGLEAALFDYQYALGHESDAINYGQTAVCFTPDGGTGLPDFCLSPAELWHSFVNLLGAQHIAFDGRPRFSKSYRLVGADEAAVRERFTPAVLDFFEETPGLTVESVAGRLLIYRHGRRAKVDDLRPLLDQAFRIRGWMSSSRTG